MKKIAYILCGVALTVALGFSLTDVPVNAEDVGTRAQTVSATSVPTNMVALANTGLGPTMAGLIIANVTGTETVRVAFVSGQTYAQAPIAINPGENLVFPSSTYGFVPGGKLYASGNTANVTNSVRVTAIIK